MTFRAHLALSNNNLAEYDWTSSLIFLGPSAFLGRENIYNHIVSLINRQATWETDEDFLSLVAFVHECVHYGQDIFTGVGMWDFFHTVRMLEPLRCQIRQARKGIPPSNLSAQIQNMEAGLFLRRFNRSAADPIHTILPGIAASDPHIKLKDTDSFGLRTLLEAEAATSTFFQLQSVQQTTVQAEIISRNSGVFYPHEMPDEYNRFWFEMVSFLKQLFGQLEDLDSDSLVTVLNKMTLALLDLAFAVPSPGLLRQRNQSINDYLPGVRMFRILSAIAGMDDLSKVALSGPIGCGDSEGLATALRPFLSYDYALPSEIYRDWDETLSQLSRQMDDHALNFRIRACRLRHTHANWMVGKRIATFIETGTPIFTIGDGNGIFELSMNGDLLDFEMRKFRLFDTLSLGSYLRMTSSAVFNERYQCPFALAKICHGAKPTCRSGLATPDEVPNSEKCYIRNLVH